MLGSGSEFISGSTLHSRNFSQLWKPCQKHFSQLFCFQVNVIGEQAKVELLEPEFCFVAGASLSVFLWIPRCKLSLLFQRIFGFVAKSQTDSENLCHLFAEYDTVQPVSLVIDLLCKLLPSP